MQVEIWSKVSCPQCESAKSLLNSKGIQYTEKKIGTGQYDVSDLLLLVPAAKSVPQIFVDGAHIGGYQQLVDFLGE